MGVRTDIEWTDHTFNPWEGCSKVSPGCAHCYAEARNHRFGMDNWGKGKPRRRTSEANWRQPLKWNWQGIMLCPDCGADLHAKLQRGSGIPLYVQMCSCGSQHPPKQFRRPRVFCASLADWLDDEVPIEWLADLLKLIHDTPNLDWLLLTKRPENFYKRIQAAWDSFPVPHLMRVWLSQWATNEPAPSNWLGTSVEDQQRAEERIPELLKIPAKVRFLSCEPLLDRVVLPWKPDYSDTTGTTTKIPGIHWVIIGNESKPGKGIGRLPHDSEEGFHFEARGLMHQCKAAGVAFFMKQMPVNGKTSGDPAEWPEDLRVREFPV